MTPAASSVVLPRVARLLEDRVVALEARVQGGDETAWPDLMTSVRLLLDVLAATPALTTKQKAESLGVSPKTLLRQRKAGEVRPLLDAGRGGAIRWARGPK